MHSDNISVLEPQAMGFVGRDMAEGEGRGVWGWRVESNQGI